MDNGDSSAASSSWHGVEDFGQKVDLTVRIREILRNYPEGLSIIKELIQNADDAGARTIRFCACAAPANRNDAASSVNSSRSRTSTSKLEHLMQGPSLLAYNSASFTDTDFKSIQRIGDSLKKASGNKTGRFGVGVNSTYHLTEVPMFLSAHKAVIFDPQAKYIPNINPANPGKMIDFSSARNQSLIQQLPNVFAPFASSKFGGLRVGGGTNDTPRQPEVDGTTFRFALRSSEQASESRLSRQSHTFESISSLLDDLAEAAPSMLLFLKHVERIEIYEWKNFGETAEPVLKHCTEIQNVSQQLRQKRSYMLHATPTPEKPIVVDYQIELESTNAAANLPVGKESWMVCNQMGGGMATEMAKDPTWAHMNLVPWAGVAARVGGDNSNFPETGGSAYCFLPLPVSTKLPVHVNGYFELSSNRRDVWWGEDMAGDGLARAQWNQSLVTDIAALCYIRLLHSAIHKTKVIQPDNYERLWPTSSAVHGPWEALANRFLVLTRRVPCLYSHNTQEWVSPETAVVLPRAGYQSRTAAGVGGTRRDDCENISDKTMAQLATILSQEGPSVAFVTLNDTKLHELLLNEKCGCPMTTATPSFIRSHFSKRTSAITGLSRVTNGALESLQHRISYAIFLLEYCLQDIMKSQQHQQHSAFHSLAGCQFVPLANGELGTFSVLDNVESGSLMMLSSMGFTQLQSAQALRKHKGDANAAMEWLIEKKSDGGASDKDSGNSATSSNASCLTFGIDPFFVSDDRELTFLLKDRASQTFVDLLPLKQHHPQLYKSFKSAAVSSSNLNMVLLEPSLIADVVSWVLPSTWKGAEEANWLSQSQNDEKYNGKDIASVGPNTEWFRALWRYLCKLDHPAEALQRLSEQYCIVPTQQDAVCILSPGASVLEDPSTSSPRFTEGQGVDDTADVKNAIVSLGGRFLVKNVLPSDLTTPKEVYSYIHPSTPDGVIRCIETSVRRVARQGDGHNISTDSSHDKMISFESLPKSLRLALKTYFVNPTHQGSISKTGLASLAKFPLFRAYIDSTSEETSFVALASGPSLSSSPPHPSTANNSKPWLLVEGTTTKTDRKLMSSQFVSWDSRAELPLLKQLGVQPLTRGRFIMDFVVHLLPQADAETRNSAIRSLLLNLSSLLSGEEKFRDVVMSSPIFPTAANRSTNDTTNGDATNKLTSASKLKRASDLFDPSVPALRLLMSDNSFPADFLWADQFLLGMRSLGLRTSLDWETVLLCAKSIEEQAASSEEEEREQAKLRGRELLAFLDQNWETFFPDVAATDSETKAKKKSSKSLSQSLFGKMSAALFEDPQQKQRDAEDRARKLHLLLGYMWVPVMEEPPHPFLPWDTQFRSSPVARPADVAPQKYMWFVSSKKRILDASVRSTPLSNLFGWGAPPKAIEVATQLHQLTRDYESVFLEQVRRKRQQEEKLKQQEHEENQTKANSDGAKSKTSASTQNERKQPLTEQYLCQTMTAHIPELYSLLDAAASRSGYEQEVMQSILFGSAWLWIGDRFVSSEHAAFQSSVNAAPYLYTVPSDLVCFDHLLQTLGVRRVFDPTDFASVLSRMAAAQQQSSSSSSSSISKSKTRQFTAKDIELAVQLVQLVSDAVMRLGQGTMSEIYAPSSDNEMHLASSMMFDDAPWLSKTAAIALGSGSEHSTIFIHPKVSAAVAEKVGAKSFREFLLQSKTDLEFGTGIVHESFGQSESITRRLRNIIEMYPEGPQQLSELIQNADDAKATEVKFMISVKQHGTKSLLGPKLKHWQGPALLVFNNSTFTKNDFINISRIGQASKLEKLTSTGRFGLGFNSVFHWTDVPSIVSGEHLVMFDPHEQYVPGASSSAKGIKVKFAGSQLAQQFPDQMSPFCLDVFGCDMQEAFEGTLMRFPFRNEYTSAHSEISKTRAAEGQAVKELLDNFKQSISKVLLFLRHVKKIQMYYEGDDGDIPTLLYEAEVTHRRKVAGEGLENTPTSSLSSLDHIKSLALAASYGRGGAGAGGNNSWSAISDFIQPPGTGVAPLGKDAFYSKLLSTPERLLPKTQHVVTIQYTDYTTMENKSGSAKEKKNGEFAMIQDAEDHGHEEGAIEIQHIATSDGDEEEDEDTKDLALPQKEIITILDTYLILTALGGGRCQMMACSPKFRHMKLLPWGGVAAHLTRNHKQVALLNGGQSSSSSSGNAFCFLPLPAETGLPLHINGYFELSANRRDIWHGDDMTGEGRVRCEWNNVLLSDVIAPLYVNLIEVAGRLVDGQGQRPPDKYYHSLFPVNVKHSVWKQVLQEFYRSANQRPILYSELNGGKWIKPTEAITIELLKAGDDNEKDTARGKEHHRDGLVSTMNQNRRLHQILLDEGVNVSCLPRPIMQRLKEEGCSTSEATPAWTRFWFRKQNEHQHGSISKSLQNRDTVFFLLNYCASDLIAKRQFGVLQGLPFVPLCNGGLGCFDVPEPAPGSGLAAVYFVCNELERELLSHASGFVVDVWGPDEGVNEMLKGKDFHSATNVRSMTASSFVALLRKRYPVEWQDLPEVRWDSTISSSKHQSSSTGSRHPCTSEWLAKLWGYVIARQEEQEASQSPSGTEHQAGEALKEDDVLATFGDTCHILPSVVGGENDKTLMKLTTTNMAVVSPTGVSGGGDIIKLSEEVEDVLKAIGVRILDVSPFSVKNGERNRVVKLLSQRGYVQAPNAVGLLRAIQATFPPDIETGDLIRRIALRFRHVDGQGKNVLRTFLCESLAGTGSTGNGPSPSPLTSNKMNSDLARVAQALPIFLVYNQLSMYHRGQSSSSSVAAEPQYSDVVGKKFLPPLGAEEFFLDTKFVKVPTIGARAKAETSMMKMLGVVPMEKSAYYEEQVCPRLNSQQASNNNVAVSKDMAEAEEASLVQILEEFPKLARQAGPDWVERISLKLLIPNRLGQKFKAAELYDPQAPVLAALLDDSMIPHSTFCQQDLLVSLRLLGMSTELSLEGVLVTARRVQSLQDSGNHDSARKLGTSLLNFLDNAEMLEELEQNALLTVANEDFSRIQASSSVEGVEVQSGSTDGTDKEAWRRFWFLLREISWLPIESFQGNSGMQLKTKIFPPRPLDQNRGAPRNVHGPLVSVASPMNTRPKEEAWLCSYSMEIVPQTLRTNGLKTCLGWDTALPAAVVARQLLALSDGLESASRRNDSRSYRRQLMAVLPQCYEILDAYFQQGADGAQDVERERVTLMLQDKAWVWVGDSFIAVQRVALDAPANARPYLFSVPMELLSYRALLRHCGVRERFSAADYATLTANLHAQLNGQPASAAQLDLAVGMARLLSRVPEEDRGEVSKIFLPARDGTLHASEEMTFDDAPWLSAIINRRSGSHQLFVHLEVGNDVARACGAKSFRDTVTAYQNGMSVLPCPKPESLAQLFTDREGYKEGPGQGRRGVREDCRALLDILELAELHGTQQVSILFDHRTHRNERLLHPMLSQAQGPSIAVCLHDTLLEMEDVVKLSSPFRHYMGHVSGERGCGSGGQGMPRSGMGLCGAYRLTDCPQILLGDSLIFFDPNGECFYDGNLHVDDKNEVPISHGVDSAEKGLEKDEEPLESNSEKEKPGEAKFNINERVSGQSVARRYCVTAEFPEQFPDQFEAFSSLPFGVKEAVVGRQNIKYRSTIFRLPLRQAPSPICNRVFPSEHVQTMLQSLISQVASSFLFTCNLQCIDVSQWLPSQLIHKGVLSSRVTSSPLERRNYYEDLKDYEWKPNKSKFVKLLQTNWNPIRTSMTVEITNSLNDEDEPREYVDSFLISSIFGPSNLRKMACADVVKPLKLLPFLSLAAHLSRKSTLDDGYIKTPRTSGSLFVGLDSGEPTGLPFHLNAPVFLHETKGVALLDKNDDAAFRSRHAKAREVQTKDGERKVVALHVWNREALLAACIELIPNLLKDARDILHETEGLAERHLYYLWPRHDRVKSKFSSFVTNGVYERIAKPGSRVFLTQSGDFTSVENGCFASPSYEVKESASRFFQSKLSMFAVPPFVAEDLVRAGMNLKKLSPRTARHMIRKHPKLMDACKQDVVLMVDVLEYCLSDLVSSTSGGGSDSSSNASFSEILGLSIVPMEDGSVQSFGKQVVLARPEQQYLLPFMKDRFVSLYALNRLSDIIESDEFVNDTKVIKFGAKTLAENMQHLLPSHWEDKDFVPWDQDTCTSPSKEWLFRFWSEVNIHDADAVQLFRRWPLIPTKHGELASCGNFKFILRFYPDCTKQTSLHESLLRDDDQLLERLKEKGKQHLALQAAEERATRRHDGANDGGICYDEWSLSSGEELEKMPLPLPGDEMSPLDAPEGQDHSGPAPLIDEEGVPSIVFHSTVATSSITIDPALRTSGAKALNDIITKLRCPVLELAYFLEESIPRILPSDRLTVSRNVLVTINHCMNYWPHYRASEFDAEEPRLCWDTLSGQDKDELLLLLSSSESGRLSLLPSDLTMIRKLPVFEALSGDRVSIEHADEHYTLHDHVEVRDLSQYLPRTLRNKFLVDKSNMHDILQDLGVQELNEAVVMQKFVLPELQNMPANQKEKVCQMVLDKWDTLKSAEDFVAAFKLTPFVKKTVNASSEDVVYVKPCDLLDPRHLLLASIFDRTQNVFPHGEFRTKQWLEILSAVGLQESVSKETFLKCACVVESEASIEKSYLLHEYFVEHYTELSSNDFTSQYADIRCVPASLGEEALSLYKFCDVSVPTHRNIVFQVLPIIPLSIVPPQVLFSSLGIVSPPSVITVLNHFRLLTEAGGRLDQWNYQHGTVEQVFRSVFAFLEENLNDISPRVLEALREKPVIPVGTTLVKASRLFFRLTKDLAPFFYEVPRIFGAHERLLRELGVRESPKWQDYSVSLAELKREIGDSRMNANELRSVLDVVQLIASDCSSMDRSLVYVPDEHGALVSLQKVARNDAPWLLQGRRVNRQILHLSHPKLVPELCQRLGIPPLSQCVTERLDRSRDIVETSKSDDATILERAIRTGDFLRLVQQMVLTDKEGVTSLLKRATLVEVESLQTALYLSLPNGGPSEDVTLESRAICFIDKSSAKILLDRQSLPLGVSPELAIASAMCDHFHLLRHNIAGISAVLSSQLVGGDVKRISEVMGICSLQDDESNRGDPGFPVGAVDMDLMELKPLKVFSKGEVVAVRDGQNDDSFMYATVLEGGGGQSLSQVNLDSGKGGKYWLTTEIFSFQTSARGRAPLEDIDLPTNSSGIVEESLELSDTVEVGGNTNLPPLKRREVLSAVQDLLKSANMSLSNNVEDLMDQNLKLQDQLSESKVTSDKMIHKGRDLAQSLSRGVDAFLCPITRDMMRDPVICSDGHTYEREAIEQWLRSNSRSPKTNQHLPSRTLIPNHGMKQAIDAMEESIASVKRFSKDLEGS